MGTRRPDDDIPLPPPPTDILSKSTNILTDSGSHRPISGSALQGRLPFVTMAINALSEHLDSDAGANPAAASGQLSRWRAPRPTDNRISAIPGAASRGFQAIKERRDTNRFDIELDARSRAGQVSPRIGIVLLFVILNSAPPLQSPDANSTQSASVHPISNSSNISVSKESRAAQREGVTNPGPILSAGFVQLISKLQYSPVSQGSEETKERKESPFIQVDSPRERTVIRPYSEQVDRTASVRPSAKPSIPSPPLKRQSVSTSPLSSPPATSLTSSRMLTLRCTLPYEPQAPSRGTPFESPHPGEDRGKARPDEQGHNPSAIPPEHTPATTDPPTLPQPVSGPRRSDRTNSPIQANEGVDRGGEQAMVAPPSERNERKRVMVPEEHENRLKDSANAEPNSTTGYAADVLHYIKASPDMSDSRGEVGQSSNSTLSLDRGESRITPSASVPTQNHPGGVIGLRSINNTNSTVSSTDPCPRPQSLPGDSQALATVTSSTCKSSIVFVRIIYNKTGTGNSKCTIHYGKWTQIPGTARTLSSRIATLLRTTRRHRNVFFPVPSSIIHKEA
jgi:hypothetical protein